MNWKNESNIISTKGNVILANLVVSNVLNKCYFIFCQKKKLFFYLD